jgi:group I intron endonuclease
LAPPFTILGAGIYSIINSLNGKIYVGSAVRLNVRWNCHRHELEQGTHGNRHLLRAFKKTPDALQIQLIEEISDPSKENLLSREQFWINFYQSSNPELGYNISPTARSCRGIKRDPEYVARVAKSLTGYKHTEQARANMRAGQALVKRGPKSDAAKHNMRMAQLGKKRSREAVAKGVLANRLNKTCFKPVAVMDLDGVELGRFESITEAERCLGFSTSNIHAVCKGKRPVALGFKWKYV